MKMYVYLVENKTTRDKYVMVGNLKNCNLGSWKYLYSFVSKDYKYAIATPYGLRSNVSIGVKYNSNHYRVVHQTAV